MKTIKIYFNNVNGLCLKYKISKLFVQALHERLQELNIEVKNVFFEVSLKFVAEEEIRELNKKFRGIDRETDVLSFPMISIAKENIVNGLNILGDIAICKNIAIMQAAKYGHSVRREICFLALHGFLHLLGYDHTNEVDEEIMASKADKILRKYGVDR